MYKAYIGDSERMRKRKQQHEAWKKECRKRAREDFVLYRTDRKEWAKQFEGDTERLAKAEAMMKRKTDLHKRLRNI